ncbi:hypothetical protein PRZ61_12270 [Halomonas pacifica]|uniref:hypothetical protein n=1 Tax=Bisbaumannia pacifica TaxID=77098 RepID=UPI002358A0DF|nr:hypothetical protein [Halomonas pacifica]MDC8804217.1 hypothetical protein [Halomonas pacifica]
MSTKTQTPKPAARREVELAKPIIQGGREYSPGGKDKPRLTEAQIARLSESGHIATGGKTAKQEG